MWLVGALGGVGVVSAVVALLATRLEHMAVALCVVGGALAGALAVAAPDRRGLAGALLLLPVAAAMTIAVLGAVTVLEVDARPRRQLRWWKTLLLVPLVLVAVAMWPDLHAAAAPQPPEPTAVPTALTLLTIAGTALVVPLLARRREAR